MEVDVNEARVDSGQLYRVRTVPNRVREPHRSRQVGPTYPRFAALTAANSGSVQEPSRRCGEALSGHVQAILPSGIARARERLLNSRNAVLTG